MLKAKLNGLRNGLEIGTRRNNGYQL